MRKSSTTAAAKRAGAKPSRTKTNEEETTNTTPETGAKSPQTAEHGQSVPQGATDDPGPGEDDTAGSDGAAPPTDDGPPQDETVAEWGAALNSAVDLINALPPQIRSVALGQTVPSGAPRPDIELPPVVLSASAKARLRHHVRSAAGRLAAAIKAVDEARQAWELEVTEARRQGYSDDQILGQALDAELTASDIPPHPNT